MATPPSDPDPETGSWRGLTIAPEDRCSPYDSDTQTDIVEHIVARSKAHDSWLCSADDATRTRFVRDLLNLTLASPALNRSQKSDTDAAGWRCC